MRIEANNSYLFRESLKVQNIDRIEIQESKNAEQQGIADLYKEVSNIKTEKIGTHVDEQR